MLNENQISEQKLESFLNFARKYHKWLVSSSHMICIEQQACVYLFILLFKLLYAIDYKINGLIFAWLVSIIRSGNFNFSFPSFKMMYCKIINWCFNELQKKEKKRGGDGG